MPLFVRWKRRIGWRAIAVLRHAEEPTSPRPSPPAPLCCAGGEGESLAVAGECGRAASKSALCEAEEPTSPRPSLSTPLRCAGGEGELLADTGEIGSAAFGEAEEPTSPRPSPPTPLRCAGGVGELLADAGESGSADFRCEATRFDSRSGEEPVL